MRRVKVLLFFISILYSSIRADIYIEIEGANVKKANFALGNLHPIADGENQNPKLASTIYDKIQADLEFANLFNSIPKDRYANLDTRENLYKLDFEEWGLVNASFVLKLGYKIIKDEVLLEALFYTVSGKKKLFATRYQYKTKHYERLVQALLEDILGTLTGQKGLFNSRIAMVCANINAPAGRQTKEIYLVDPDGSNFTPVTADNTVAFSPAWSPDGKYLAYTQYQTRLRFNKAAKKKIPQLIPIMLRHNLVTGDRSVVSEKSGLNNGAAWSPDQKSIAATLSFTGKPELYLLDPNGVKEPESISRALKIRDVSDTGFRKSYASTLFDVEPDWSPDGKEMVFSSARTGHPMIYILNLESQIARQLTFAGTYNSSPSWSPKGDKILFSAQRSKTGNFDVFMIDPDGNNLNRITQGGKTSKKRIHYEDPDWAPTATHFTVSSNSSGRYAVYVMSVDSQITRRVSPPSLECTMPTWSPRLN